LQDYVRGVSANNRKHAAQEFVANRIVDYHMRLSFFELALVVAFVLNIQTEHVHGTNGA
jgi:hypothetical protein